MCCDATITLHKCNTNIQELRTLPNTLLVIVYGDSLSLLSLASSHSGGGGGGGGGFPYLV